MACIYIDRKQLIVNTDFPILFNYEAYNAMVCNYTRSIEGKTIVTRMHILRYLKKQLHNNVTALMYEKFSFKYQHATRQ